MPWTMPPRLNLGCGHDIRPDYVNADLADLPGVDVRFDMNDTRWPFDDDLFVDVLAKHCLEHLYDLIAPIGELWRICRHGATVHVEAPHFQHSPLDVWGDPTHRRPLGPSTFTYWHPSMPMYGHEVGAVSRARFVTVATAHSEMYLVWDLVAYKQDDPALLARHVDVAPWRA